MSEVICPHCLAVNQVGSSFCESCGKALPTSAQGGPRIVSDGNIASSDAGQSLQEQELRTKANSAKGALLAVALVQFVFGMLFYFLLRSIANEPRSELDMSVVNFVLGSTIIISMIYVGLWFWAKSSPFPATLVGLVLYCTIWVGTFIQNPSANSAPIGIAINVIIVAVLVKAVQAGWAYRKLQAEAGGRLG